MVDGTLRNQGQEMKRGDAYAAAAGSSHTDFATDSGATYFLAFDSDSTIRWSVPLMPGIDR